MEIDRDARRGHDLLWKETHRESNRANKKLTPPQVPDLRVLPVKVTADKLHVLSAELVG